MIAVSYASLNREPILQHAEGLYIDDFQEEGLSCHIGLNAAKRPTCLIFSVRLTPEKHTDANIAAV